MTTGHQNPFEAQIRAAGPVIDVAYAKALYAPLQEQAPAGGVVHRDLAYGRHARQVLDVHVPVDRQAGGHPVLIFVHGGGFVRGDKGERENVARYFTRHGVLTILPNYRLGPGSRWPAGAHDVAAAFEWARRHAADYGGDPDRIVIAGESAGAAHAAAAVLVSGLQPAGGIRPAGLALVSGVYNVELELRARRQFGIATPDPRNEAYFGADFGRYPAQSTVDLVDVQPLPVLISYAELDPLQMQVQAGELFARLVTRHGFDPDIQVVRGHNHITQLCAINTADDSLAKSLLDFVQRTAPQPGPR
jgi:triacylglycerol lipase